MLCVADEDYGPLSAGAGQDGLSGSGDISGPAEFGCPLGRFAGPPAKVERGDQRRGLGRTHARSTDEFLWLGLGQPMEAAVLGEQAGRHVQRALAGTAVPEQQGEQFGVAECLWAEPGQPFARSLVGR